MSHNKNSIHRIPVQDLIYHYNKSKLDQFRRDKPWKKHPKYFTNCKMNIVAATKMIKHAIYGLNKEMKEYGMGTQVMGFLIGRPQLTDPQNPIKYELLICGYMNDLKMDIIIPTDIIHSIVTYYPYHIFCELFDSNIGNTLIITDCIETPINDCESHVIADDEKVLTLMTKIQKRVELSHGDNMIIGWYHSVMREGCLYNMRAQKIYTHLLWQMQFGIWIGIKIDPIKCLSTKQPQFIIFRMYPPNYVQTKKFQAPNGIIYETEDEVIRGWGRSYDRYYLLKNEYFMSCMIKYSLDIIYKHHQYIQQLTSLKMMESDYKDKLSKTINVIAKKTSVSTMDDVMDINKDMIIDHCIGGTFQYSKYKIFNCNIFASK